jgi:hypothetical protein
MASYSSSSNLSGLPWGSLSLLHVVSRGHARETEHGRGSSGRSYSHSSVTDPRSQQQSLDGRSPYEVAQASFGEELEMGENGGVDEDGLFEEAGWDESERSGPYYGYPPPDEGSDGGNYGGRSH